MPELIFIEHVTPTVDGGLYPVKRVTGEPCVVEADIFRDGHDVLRAALRWRRKGARRYHEVPLLPLGNDRWRGSFPLTQTGAHEFVLQAWSDRFATWLADLTKRVGADQDVASELLEGIALLQPLRERARDADRRALDAALRALERDGGTGVSALAALGAPALQQRIARLEPRADRVRSDTYPVWADRPLARFSTWYEFFPRSQGTRPGHASTLRQAERRLKDIAAMGFDVLYLPPVHPIGTTHRKGRNNALVAEPGDPGSPWAIGNEAGGHTAIEPALGTLADFRHFVRAARNHGLEVALDYAIQCSPDHPWVREHPEWFHHRPDGTIKYAENPPKKYQDVYPINFATPHREALWEALRDIVLFWIAQGVQIFRVDNPHTKPLRFWQWLIGTVQSEHPDTIFLSEAFTRPRVMQMLAKLGFTQSYTYFTWRNTKWELTEYLTELALTDLRDYYRPNFFANTPDILPQILQTGSRGAFQQRLLLAATLSPAYGIYSGFELCEHEAIEGREEYLNSEKYEIRTRDWDAPGNIKALITTVNALRRSHAALQRLDNLRFLHAENDQVLAFAKHGATTADTLLVCILLDPHQAQESTVWVPPEVSGTEPGHAYRVHDLLTGESWLWAERNYVRLEPEARPAHIFRIEPLSQ